MSLRYLILSLILVSFIKLKLNKNLIKLNEGQITKFKITYFANNNKITEIIKKYKK